MPSDKTKIVCASQAEESGCEIYLGCKVKFVNLTKNIAFNDTEGPSVFGHRFRQQCMHVLCIVYTSLCSTHSVLRMRTCELCKAKR